MNKKIPVYWMHCKACEILIENKLSEIDGVTLKNISQNENCIEIDVKTDKNLEEVKNVIEELGYHSIQKKVKKNDIFDYIIIFLLFIVFAILYILFQDVQIFSNILKTDNLSFFMVILIWVVASLSTCLAVTGGIVLGFAKYVDTSKNTYSHIKTQIHFHFWRIFGFTFWWAILGFVWWYLGSFWIINKILLLLAWIFMVAMWLNILWIMKLKFGMPKIFGNKILSIKNPAFAPLIWALTFFLPCWFTQSMQVYAASSGSPLIWALIMWAFALGTMPVLFLVWFGSSYFKDKNFSYVNKVMWVLVIYFWIFIFSGLANMFHFQNFTSYNMAQINTSWIEHKDITITHDGSWFEPVILEGAKTYTLTIIPKSDGLGCMFELTIPGIDENAYPVKKGIPIIINIKNPKPGKYKAVCTAMGMKHGEIIIK